MQKIGHAPVFLCEPVSQNKLGSVDDVSLHLAGLASGTGTGTGTDEAPDPGKCPVYAALAKEAYGLARTDKRHTDTQAGGTRDATPRDGSQSLPCRGSNPIEPDTFDIRLALPLTTPT